MLFVRMFHFSDAKVIIDYSLVAFRWIQENFPSYVLWAQNTGAALVQVLVYTFKFYTWNLHNKRKLNPDHYTYIFFSHQGTVETFQKIVEVGSYKQW